jgi:hypothetical protein
MKFGHHHCSQAQSPVAVPGKLLTMRMPPGTKPDDQAFERLRDDSHQNYGCAGSDGVVMLAQVAIIFLTRRLKHDNVA